MKNHKLAFGKLLKMNKRFSDLSEKQKNFIRDLMFAESREAIENGVDKRSLDIVVLISVYEEIEKREIWLPFRELKKEYQRRKYRI